MNRSVSEVTARHLQTRGAPTILVANRTFEKAQQLAWQFGGQARRFDDLPQLLTQADVVVCSTAAPHPIVTQPMVRDAMRARRGRPLTLFDIAVPRDVEARVDDLDNVYLFNIDHLQAFVADARRGRSAEVARARDLVDAAVTEYLRWLRSLEVAPLIVAVRAQLDSVRLTELARLRTRLPGLSDGEWKSVEAAMQALTNKIAHPAIQAIKSGAQADAAPAALEAIRRAFGLEDADANPSRPHPSAVVHAEAETGGDGMTDNPWLFGAAALYLLASVGYGAHLLLRRPGLACAARAATVPAVVLHTAGIGVHCAAAHTTPFTTPAETLSATAWAVALTYLGLALTLRPRPDALGAVALPAAFLCLFAGTVLHRTGPTPARDMPLLDTRLISLHVLALLLAFGLLTLAFGCAALYLAQHRMLKRKRTGGLFGRLPPLAGLEHLAFTLVAFAFPLLTVGLAAGGIAAAAGPHGPWLADRKVLASLATWLVYGLYLALHTAARWSGPRANALLLAGLPAALITYFIPTQLHQFG